TGGRDVAQRPPVVIDGRGLGALALLRRRQPAGATAARTAPLTAAAQDFAEVTGLDRFKNAGLGIVNLGEFVQEYVTYLLLDVFLHLRRQLVARRRRHRQVFHQRVEDEALFIVVLREPADLHDPAALGQVFLLALLDILL